MPGRGRGLRKDGKYLPPGQRKCDSGSQTTISYPPASGWRGGGEKTACSYSLFPKSGHVWDDSYKFKKIFGMCRLDEHVTTVETQTVFNKIPAERVRSAFPINLNNLLLFRRKGELMSESEDESDNDDEDEHHDFPPTNPATWDFRSFASKTPANGSGPPTTGNTGEREQTTKPNVDVIQTGASRPNSRDKIDPEHFFPTQKKSASSVDKNRAPASLNVVKASSMIHKHLDIQKPAKEADVAKGGEGNSKAEEMMSEQSAVTNSATVKNSSKIKQTDQIVDTEEFQKISVRSENNQNCETYQNCNLIVPNREIAHNKNHVVQVPAAQIQLMNQAIETSASRTIAMASQAQAASSAVPVSQPQLPEYGNPSFDNPTFVNSQSIAHNQMSTMAAARGMHYGGHHNAPALHHQQLPQQLSNQMSTNQHHQLQPQFSSSIMGANQAGAHFWEAQRIIAAHTAMAYRMSANNSRLHHALATTPPPPPIPMPMFPSNHLPPPHFGTNNIQQNPYSVPFPPPHP
ncbi:uncharacterized protein LOC142353616 isoform X2 [Convolutriloba macropyga]|uniref:uncharacterized protein LOC142353616 isoform X2 n=1 Tax=Convolutriloba macropyga TaxID=536237 RepID=UPI003F523F9A